MENSGVYNYGKRSHEIEKHHLRWVVDGIYRKYLDGKGYDVGYAGEKGTFLPVHQNAIGIELGTKNYSGYELPPLDGAVADFVFASHMLEHSKDPIRHIRAWYESVRYSGHIFIVVPNQYTYERKLNKPSQWNLGHHQFFTPGKLLTTIERALTPNSYEVVHFRENRDQYDYSVPLNHHPQGAYDIEVCLKKIKEPEWKLG